MPTACAQVRNNLAQRGVRAASPNKSSMVAARGSLPRVDVLRPASSGGYRGSRNALVCLHDRPVGDWMRPIVAAQQFCAGECGIQTSFVLPSPSVDLLAARHLWSARRRKTGRWAITSSALVATYQAGERCFCPWAMLREFQVMRMVSRVVWLAVINSRP